MTASSSTSVSLTRYLIEEQRQDRISADLRLLIEVVARACKSISVAVGKGALGGVLGDAGTGNVQGEAQKKLDVLSNEILPVCQHYAYIETYSDHSISPFLSVVWSGYEELKGQAANFAMARASNPGEIYPVFRELFAPSSKREGAR